tara:strand:- start:391 stop:759 length:369 start_codon:yes stop_codon:yes gene_type:complete
MTRKEYTKDWCARNKDRVAAAGKAYHQSFVGKYNSYKGEAKRRGHAFDLTQQEFQTLWQKDCSYCGRSITTIGIDRVDSSVGYQIDNVVSCCTTCNRLKSDFNKEEWLDNIYTILKYQGVIS